MKKVTVSLPQGAWGSIKTAYPKDSPEVKFTDFTGESNNFDTDVTGAITKRPGHVDFIATSDPISDQFEAVFSTGARHLLVVEQGVLKYTAGAASLSTVTSGFSTSGNFEFAQYQDNVYGCNGIDSPIVYDTITSYGGVTYTAPKTKVMGCQVPSSAPTHSLQLDSTVNQVPAGGHTYKVTYLYYDSEESNGSSASSVVTADATHTRVTVTIPVGGYGVTARKVYRDNNDGNWLLIGTVSNNTATTFSDIYPTGTTAIPTDNGLPPTFEQITTHLDRLWVSAGGNTVYHSEAGLPDIFSATGYVVCNPKDTIAGHIVFQGKLLVWGRSSMGWILGDSKSNFNYKEIPGAVGCVDPRSVQIRVVGGVPTVVWLSDKGFYEFNGSSINPISDDISDQVSVNIQQGSASTGRNTQDTTADFQGGTASAGIVISGGSVSQANPKQAYQTTAAWDAGVSKVNCVTIQADNTIKAVLPTSPTLASGTLSSGCSISGSNLTLTKTLSNTSTGTSATSGGTFIGLSFVPAVNCTLSSVTFPAGSAHNGAFSTGELKGYVLPDNGSGSPATVGSALFSVTLANTNGATPVAWSTSTQSVSISLTGGSRYWVVVRNDTPNAIIDTLERGNAALTTGTTVGPVTTYGSVTFTHASGSWTSPTYDCGALASQTASVAHTGTYSGSTSATTVVESSTDGTTWSVDHTSNSLNGTDTFALSGYRYWRTVITLTGNGASSPSVGAPTLSFSAGVWISDAIDHTTDITALDDLDYTLASSLPSGASVAVTIATSADNVTYSSYTAVGSATPARYSKVKLTITPSATETPVINNVTLGWTVVSTLVSSAIDTGSTPVAWELFQSTFSGAVVFSVRTASTSGGLSGASWATITNGSYIVEAVHPFIQWRAVLTATADTVPSVDSVTVNWLLSSTLPLRVASIFWERNYYLSAAEFGETTNSVVLKLDKDNKWRVYRDWSIATLSFFFNEPYAGLGDADKIVKWLDGDTANGSAIAMKVETAAINYEDEEHNKVLRKVYVIVKNTGATYTPEYSTDMGLTWNGMIDVETGSATFTVSSDGGMSIKRVQPDFSTSNATGKRHMFRLRNSDTNACEIRGIKFEAWIRKGEPRD